MRITLLSALALTAALTACGSGGDVGPGDAAVAGVTIAPDGLTLPVGGQGNLAAEVRDADGAVLPGATVAWSSLNGTVAFTSDHGSHREPHDLHVHADGQSGDSHSADPRRWRPKRVRRVVAQVQIGRATALGLWRQQSGINSTGVEVDGHSVVWAGLNLDLNAFMPFGFAQGLFEGGAAEPARGAANVSYILTPK